MHPTVKIFARTPVKYAFDFFLLLLAHAKTVWRFLPSAFSQTEPIEFGVLLHTCMLCHQTNKSDWRVTKNGPLLKVAAATNACQKKGTQYCSPAKKRHSDLLCAQTVESENGRNESESCRRRCLCKRQPRVLACKKKLVCSRNRLQVWRSGGVLKSESYVGLV
jgi:hypothetical protein